MIIVNGIDKRISKNILMLGYGGSRAYKTNGPDSDIDIIGVFRPLDTELDPYGHNLIIGFDDIPSCQQFTRTLNYIH